MPEAAIDAWPNCPECGQPRHTNCPFCQTAGHEFPPAHLPDTQIPEKPLVVCPTCDEPFTPEYLRACEWCDFRFEDGLETNSSYSPPATHLQMHQ